MAGGDYTHCEKCGCKTFYDAQVDYECTGDCKTLCLDCCETHEFILSEKTKKEVENDDTYLPPYRQAVLIKFGSLRPQVSKDFGVLPDQDVNVIRMCYRVKKGKSWYWRIKGFKKNDYRDQQDQEMLDEKGGKLKFTYVNCCEMK